MKIENEKLIIDEPMRDEQIEEFLTTLSQDQIQKIVIENDDIASSIVQAIWCAKKQTEVKSTFLQPFFENVMHGDDA